MPEQKETTALQSPGVERIAVERARQMAEEKWTPEHDAEHTDNELAWAAASYAIPPAPGPFFDGEHSEFADTETGLPTMWPWEPQWWKPTPDDRVRELVKAGALIAAEIDRLLTRDTASAVATQKDNS